jgi:hypothetical protein
MAADIYADGVEARRADAVRPGERAPYKDAGAQIFIWIAWCLLFAFWTFSMIIDVGIFRALAQGGPGSIRGGVGPGGAGFFLMTVLGAIVLGIAIAYGAARWATRDRRSDAMTEASTAALYNAIERAGGDDEVARSPESRRPDQRDSYRPA